MAEQPCGEYVLGIDLGTNSVGWAIIGLVDGEPTKLLRAGVRVFEAGMEGDIESGQEQSRNLKRREARLHRRQLWRRARRMTKTFNLLRQFGLLPEGDASTPEKRQDFINKLDQDIRASELFKARAKSGAYPEPEQTLPYILRSAALDEPLEPHFLGRALYHLAQRRGFLSGRLRPAKTGEEEGKVKGAIKTLRAQMAEKGSRTLGDFLSHLSPTERRIRGPEAWTARSMYEEEFERIWTAQAQHHPSLLDEQRQKKIRQALFFQRPLWFDPDTVGQCELEPGERRAPAYLLTAQRFRLLQKVNDLQIEEPDRAPRYLTPEERAKLSDALELQGDLPFHKDRKVEGRVLPSVRTLLGLPNKVLFNLQRGGEERMQGNRTTSEFYAVFGERWLDMSAEEHKYAILDVLSIHKPEALRRRAMGHWKLSAEAADRFCEISLEPDYMNLSRKALENLLLVLEQGIPLQTARKQLYPESFKASEPKPLLPPVEQSLTEIRNPAVMRSLTEFRKVVNGLIRSYGKPAYIRIELARDLKKSKKQRTAVSEINRRNEKARAKAAEDIVKGGVGIREPKREDIRKYQLAEECHWQCPYTGKTISVQALFGPEPQFDIEHIIPFSRSMDNAFQNLTLCYVPENRSAKGNKTPHEAYSSHPERYQAILDRVKRFTGEHAMVSAKLRRFTMAEDELQEFLADFRNRQLNDTAYASTLATRYVGLLYGGPADAEHRQRVFAPSGQTTAYFRNLWKLNGILNDGPSRDGGRIEKSRDDHRHHAVDAVVIGLTDTGMVKRLSDAAQRAPSAGHKRFAALEGPWPNFVETVREAIRQIIVSHRISKKVSGALHEETVYSPPQADGSVRVRKPLAALTKHEVESIADDRVKALVVSKLAGGEPKKVFATEENLPHFETSDARRIPIKRVRIKKAVPTFSLGGGRTTRHVATESNHHIEIFAELDQQGKEREWDGIVVPMHEAWRRLRAGEPVVNRDAGPGRLYKFSLAQGEVVECDGKHEGRSLFVFRKVTQFTKGGIQIGFAPLNDARKAREMQVARAWLWTTPNTLGDRHARKMTVNPLGEVTEAHD